MTDTDNVPACPDTEGMLSGLKPFQRDTVDHVFNRLWSSADPVDRFLVADEVGLGKTLIAKGVSARTIERLWSNGQPITIVYICTNAQIARQNLHRLRDLTGGDQQGFADRLTLLPRTMGRTDRHRVNVISFTPGTSFRLGAATGRVEERVLLHWMLRHLLDDRLLNRRSALRYFADQVDLDKFTYRLSWETSQPDLAVDLLHEFESYLKVSTGPFGKSLLADLEDELERWKGTQNVTREMGERQRRMIGALRIAMAQVSVNRLAPDLVILDEFQRFKDLFPSADVDDEELDDAQRLAQHVISAPGTKSLVLSATPYKMFTLPDEPEGEDHYRDFRTTVEFLAGKDRSDHVMSLLSKIRTAMLTHTGEGRDRAEQLNREASNELKRVMSRTERLGVTTKRDGMLVEKHLPTPELHPQDLQVWMATHDIARLLSGQDAFEYWRSVSYPINLMDPSFYQVKRRLLGAVDTDPASCASVIHSHRNGLLRWNDVEKYKELDPANPKMRSLTRDVMDREVWKLAWLPPSLPYVEPLGAFAGEGARGFTKRLVFSSWNVVPKAIATMVSYEAERRLINASAHQTNKERPQYDNRQSMALLRFQWDTTANQPTNLEMLALVHPSVVLARLGDPLEIARTSGRSLPLNRELLLDEVTERIQAELDLLDLPTGQLATGNLTPRPGAGRAWYGVAPYLLDRAHGIDNRDLLGQGHVDSTDTESTSRLGDHMTFAADPDLTQLGPIPDDLARVLAKAAVAGPGVCALRALGRTAGRDMGSETTSARQAALSVSRAIISLFNRPTITAAVRSAQPETEAGAAYWQQVLDYCIEGNLQATLDEYVHTLVDSLGLSSELPADRMTSLADKISSTATIRTAENVIHDFTVYSDRVAVGEQRIRSHIAARFGRVEGSESAEAREASVLDSFNSPFWPFVLASTSMGQEGLDFHTYSHSVVHWNLPSNPVDLEQREGRVHRYKGHAIRKNIATAHGRSALDASYADPWAAMFDAAEAAEPPGSSLISPYWVYEGATSIERYVPAMPLSREKAHYRRLQRTLGAYRSVMGQSRQEDLIQLLGPDVEWPMIDLTPPRRTVDASHLGSQAAEN